MPARKGDKTTGVVAHKGEGRALDERQWLGGVGGGREDCVIACYVSRESVLSVVSLLKRYKEERGGVAQV